MNAGITLGDALAYRRRPTGSFAGHTGWGFGRHDPGPASAGTENADETAQELAALLPATEGEK